MVSVKGAVMTISVPPFSACRVVSGEIFGAGSLRRLAELPLELLLLIVHRGCVFLLVCPQGPSFCYHRFAGQWVTKN